MENEVRRQYVDANRVSALGDLSIRIQKSRRISLRRRVRLCVTASYDLETHTSSFTSIFLCFFDFRLSTFSHCASAGSPSGIIGSESETRGDVFNFFEGADEDEEGRFMAVAFWKCSAIGSHVPRALISSIRPWAVDILTPTCTIQSTTSPLAQSG